MRSRTVPAHAAPSNPEPLPESPMVGYLTPSEAAAFLSVSVDELERRRRRGDGPRFAQWGRRMIRYSIVELDRWMEARTVSNSAEAAERPACRGRMGAGA